MDDIFHNGYGYTIFPTRPLVSKVPKIINTPTNKSDNPNHQQEQIDKYFDYIPPSTKDIDGKGEHIDLGN